MTSNFVPLSLPSSLSTSLLSCSNTGQLADFCAQAVPTIWSPRKHQPLKRTTAFKQFCQKVIKATQVSCACIVLGLYYIHRLRSAYPFIHASVGSEIRLFTTALVLANKYLDDNTFTNKTWSEVSSIPVVELNIMEMEFLSALQYNIHLPYDQYFQWVGQCQQWFGPTIMHISMDSTPLEALSSSHPPSTLKRTFQDTLDDSRQIQNKKRSIPAPVTTVANYSSASSFSSSSSSSSSPVSYRMPYTPPESFQPIPISYPVLKTPSSYPSVCYPAPPIYVDDECCGPILSWSSSSSLSSSSSVPDYLRRPYQNQNHHIYQSHIPSNLSAPISAPLHYSTSLLATRVRSLEID